MHPLKGYERHYLVKSKKSNFVFCSRVPTDEELLAHYDGYKRDDYASPLTVRRYHHLLDRFEKYRSSNRLLDVGCGIGLFLDVARERGWEVHGTEFTDAAMSICEGKGLRMRQGRLDPAAYDGAPFDVVTYFEVLEHINNPLEEVPNLRRVLREGGLLYFTTPNFNAVERLLLKDRYDVISYPEHLSYYTPKTMHYLLERFGFTKIDVETTGISITRLRNSLGLTHQRPASQTSDDEVIRITLEASRGMRAMKAAANRVLTLLGIGNSIKGFYERAADRHPI